MIQTIRFKCVCQGLITHFSHNLFVFFTHFYCDARQLSLHHLDNGLSQLLGKLGPARGDKFDPGVGGKQVLYKICFVVLEALGVAGPKWRSSHGLRRALRRGWVNQQRVMDPVPNAYYTARDGAITVSISPDGEIEVSTWVGKQVASE